MPTYVYKFVDTGETIEVQQGFHDPSLTEALHPTTGVPMPVKKVFMPVGVTFKGGGFYKTDSRGGTSKPTPAAADGGSEKSSSNGAGDASPASSSSASSPAPAAAPAAGASSTSG